MKKFFIAVFTILAVLWLSLRIFSYYNSKNILSNQAAFEVYLDINESDIDNYFRLEEGTYNSEQHLIICTLPLKNVAAFKPRNTVVKMNLENIDCNEEYNKERHIKYDNTELAGNTFTIMIIKKVGFPLQLLDVNSGLGRQYVIASAPVIFNYTKGKINHVVFESGNIYDYCKK